MIGAHYGVDCEYVEEEEVADVDRLVIEKETYAVGESIMVTAVGKGTDWIGIGNEGGYTAWYYVESKGSEVPVDILTVTGELAPGQYIIRLIANDAGWTTPPIDTITITVE